MKYLNYTASVIQNTNKIISNTNCDWTKITEGTFIKFSEDNSLYIVQKNEKTFFLRDFKVLDLRRISIDGNTGIKISKGDLLNIIYVEYELSLLMSIKERGKNYKIGELIKCAGGTPSLDVANNTIRPASFLVKEVDSEGGVLSVSLDNRGHYINPPQQKCEMQSAQNGIGAVFELCFSENDSKKVIQRNVQIINPNDSNSILLVDYQLPEGLKNGSLSIEKWEITLSQNYLGHSKTNASYEVFKDLTPNYKMLIPAKGSAAMDEVIKSNLFILDSKIKELEDKIKLLENK